MIGWLRGPGRRPPRREEVLIDEAPDPGNVGFTLRLVERGAGRSRTRWVRARNGTAPHAEHLIPVAADAVDAIAAIAATYGIAPAQYLTLSQRT